MDLTQASTNILKAMACFLQSLLPYTPLILWPAFGFLAVDVARAKGCKDIKMHLILGPFGYLNALAMPDLKTQMYLRAISEKQSLEAELQSILSSPQKTSTQMSAR